MNATMRSRWFWIGLLSNALACSETLPDEPALQSDAGPVGVRAGFTIAEETPLQLLSDHDPIVVRYAPQGGHVMWIGARISGLPPGPARLRAMLLDPETLAVFVEDDRRVELVPTADGSGEVEPDLSTSASFAHLVACPNYGSRPVEGVEWALYVEVADSDDEQRVGSTLLRVVPACAPGPRFESCQCECSPDYFLGKCGVPT